MKRTKIAVTGALGRMGTQIIKKINETEDLEVVLAIEIEGCSKKGMDIGEVIGIDKMGINLTTSDELEDSLIKDNPDVLIDFTTSNAALKNIRIASKIGVNLVIGTTGFSNKQREEIESYITNNKVAAVISPNMSKGVNVFFRMAMIIAEYLKGYDIEIIEKHHRFKKDSPSGTALKVGDLIAEAIGEDLSDKAVYGREKGLVHNRKAGEIGFHSIRGGGIIGDHTVIFADADERIEITHIANNRGTFVNGAIAAARFIKTQKKGRIYNTWDVLGISNLSKCE